MTSINQLNANQPLISKNSNSKQRLDATNGKTNDNVAPNEITKTKNNQSVTLSSRAKKMGNLQQTLANEPQFDKEKVTAIKEDIASGKYKVNVDKLADCILKFGNEFADMA